MVVDDSYILVGSANINQRSLSGTRDTEMAVGCWQPSFPEPHPYGDVHVFRMSLWVEHMGINDVVFRSVKTIIAFARCFVCVKLSYITPIKHLHVYQPHKYQTRS